MASRALEPRNFSGVGVFVKTQILTKSRPPPPSVTFAGQTAIVTGSNVGIGLETCRQMLRRGLSRLVMAVRSPDKGDKEAALLRKEHPGATIDVWALDMTSYDSIRGFASRCKTALSRLDIAILNAAVFNAERRLSPSGRVETIQVNYLSTSLLAILLLPLLKTRHIEGRPGRLMLAGSNMALRCELPNRNESPVLPSFDSEAHYASPMECYAASKLALLVLADKLSEAVRAGDVIVNVVDPGFTAGSSLHRSFTGVAASGFGLVKTLAARTLEQASWTYLDAVAVKGAESHGGFLVNWEVYPFSPVLYTAEGKACADRLWAETLEELEFAGVERILDSMS